MMCQRGPTNKPQGAPWLKIPKNAEVAAEMVLPPNRTTATVKMVNLPASSLVGIPASSVVLANRTTTSLPAAWWAS